MTRDELTRAAAQAVGAAQRQLPPKIRALAREVPVHYVDKPDADVLRDGFPPDILGLFTGNPHAPNSTKTPTRRRRRFSSIWTTCGTSPTRTSRSSGKKLA